MSEHLPLYRRTGGLTAYDCTCEWSTFDCDTEPRAWSYFREHHRAETNTEPTGEGRDQDVPRTVRRQHDWCYSCPAPAVRRGLCAKCYAAVHAPCSDGGGCCAPVADYDATCQEPRAAHGHGVVTD